MIKVILHGEQIRLVEDLMADFQANGPSAVMAAAVDLRNEVQSQLSRSSGAAASPGQPPAEHSGDLRNSIQILPLVRHTDSLTSGIYTTHPGAGRLEWGGVDVRGVRTFPHPYLSKAIRAVAARVNQHFDKVAVA